MSLVGYTNAGKTTLFNRLTGARRYAADQLFATLDTTLRRVHVPGAEPILLSDTVGFIRDLPHNWSPRSARRSRGDTPTCCCTWSTPATRSRRADRRGQRRARGDRRRRVPQILVFNKIDAAALAPGVERDESGKIPRFA